MLKSSRKAHERRQREQDIFAQAKIEAIRRDAKHGLGGKCLPCWLEVPLRNGQPGSGLRDDYNHVVPRSRLPGERNWPILHSVENLAPTCRAHHDDYDRRPEFWLKLMKQEFGYAYDTPIFQAYL